MPTKIKILVLLSASVKRFGVSRMWDVIIKLRVEKFGIRETPNLSTDTDSSTDIFVFDGVKKVAETAKKCTNR